MDSLSFRIPEQHAPGKDAFDTRPAAVQRWVEQLPIGHTGETAKRLYGMLREVNRLAIKPGERFELLQTIAGPLQVVLDSLERHFTGMPFPLPGKSLRVAQVSTGLLHELVIGYQAVLDGEENASWLFRMTHSRMWLETMHRLLYYLNRILFNFRLIHRSPPAGVWLAMHRLYWLALEHERQAERVAAPGEGEGTTIEGEYMRALLLSLVQPQLFSREQFAQMHDNMRLWLAHCELVEVSMLGDGVQGLCIQKDADAPYTLLSGECGIEGDGEGRQVLVFDIGGLGLYLAGLLEELGEEEETLRPKGGKTLSRDTLELLSETWQMHESARAERKHSDVAVEVAIGMNGIFQLLQGETESSARGISDQTMSEELEPLALVGENEEHELHNQGQALNQRAEKDVWDKIFQATAFTQKSWSVDAEEREYHYIHAHQRDYTETGYCLDFDKQQMEPLQVGELMGVRSGDTDTLKLCMVRWLNDGDSRIITGLMRLTESVEPALVVVHHDQRRTALNCLLGIGDDHKPQLFLPHLPGIRTKRLYLVVDGKEVPLTLHHRVVVSPLFDGYHFDAASISGDEEESLDELNSQLHDLTHPQPKERESDDFSDLWNSL